MFALLTSIPAVVAAHPQGAYGVVLLLALSESIPLIGAVVPGTAVIVGIAALVPQGAVQLWPLLLTASAGAIAGDGVSFWLGRHYHRAMLTRWPFSRYPGLVERSDAFFRRHGGKSVMLARFIPGVRAFVPLVAGMLDMPAGRFYAVNVVSALAWALVHITPGMLVGVAFHIFGPAAIEVAMLTSGAALLAWVALQVITFVARRRKA